MRRVSIKDVAREAGVSTSTVSYVLNRKPAQSISAETAGRVWQAVRRLDYVPNLNARSLTSRRTNLIGVVMPQAEPGGELLLAYPYYGALLSAIEHAARQCGYHLLLTGCASDQGYESIARNRGVDGVIFAGPCPEDGLAELHALRIPVVLTDACGEAFACHTVSIDDRQGGRLATRHLIAQGHRAIAFVSGAVSERGGNQQRFLGYLDALGEAGLTLDETRLYLGAATFDFAQEAAQEMGRRGWRETAAFATADVLGLGLIQGLRRLGRRVPDDLSVVGFDDLEMARMCDPPLTTVRQDIAEKGRHTVRMILNAAEGCEGRQEQILPLSLVVRESVRRVGPPAGS